MLVTLDTNIIYQAMRSSSGASNFILREIRNNKIQLALSLPVFIEYEAVCLRKSSLEDFELKKSDVQKLLRYLAFIGHEYEPYFLYRPNLRDESDNIFIELAIASQSEFLITNNIKDFVSTDLNIDFIKIVTPAEFLKLRRSNNG